MKKGGSGARISSVTVKPTTLIVKLLSEALWMKAVTMCADSPMSGWAAAVEGGQAESQRRWCSSGGATAASTNYPWLSQQSWRANQSRVIQESLKELRDSWSDAEVRWANSEVKVEGEETQRCVPHRTSEVMWLISCNTCVISLLVYQTLTQHKIDDNLWEEAIGKERKVAVKVEAGGGRDTRGER